MALVAVVSLLVPTSGRCETGPSAGVTLDRSVQETLGAYFKDPEQRYRDVIALGRAGTDGWPAPFLLLLADAHLRAGQLGTARRVLAAALARDPGSRWATWADLGLGWIALVGGDFRAARARYVDAGTHEGGSDVAPLVLALLDAAEGRGEVAVAALEDIEAAPGTPAALRPLAALGAAYAWYWSGRHERAIASFSAAADRFPGGPLVDDARYGMAWSRWRNGERAAAIGELRALAAREDPDVDPDHIPSALLNLDARALLRASRGHYRRLTMGRPEDQLVGLLDVDGAGFARAVLKRIGETPPEAPAEVRGGAAVAAGREPTPAAPVITDDRRPVPLHAAAPAGPAAIRRHAGAWPWLLVAMSAAALLGGWWRSRRGRAGGARRTA